MIKDANLRNLRWGLSVPTWLLGSRVFREAEALEAVEESAYYVPKTSWR
jgi:hypothetical protein